MMAPSPATSPLRLSQLIARQEEPTNSSATFLELLLITFALIISSVLTFTPKKKDTRKQLRSPVLSGFIIVIAVLFTISAFALALASLILGWLRVISLDAVAAIVFALGPAFISIPLEILSYWQDSLTTRMMWRNKSLNIPTAQFRYIRFIGGEDIQKEQQCLNLQEPKPVEDPKPRKWADGNIMVIRYMRPPFSTGFVTRLLNSLCSMGSSPESEDPTALPLQLHSEDRVRNATQPRDPHWKHVYGRHISTHANFSTIQDIDDGITSWWWTGVSSARHIVARPAILHLRSKRRVVNALALLSDIISIGDLVLYFHQDIFDWMLRNDQEMRTAVTSAPGFTCNRILQQLEMDGWDPVGTEVLLSNFRFPIQSRKRYSILYLILTEKSQQFLIPGREETTDSDEIYSGQKVLKTLWEARDEENFDQTAEQCVNKWLRRWGLEIDEVKSLKARCPKDRKAQSLAN